MALGYIQLGAGEVYWDGKLLEAFGKVGDSPETEEIHFVSEAHMKVIPLPITREKHHVLAVRYSNFAMHDNPNPDIPLGFALSLTEQDLAIEQKAALNRWVTIYQMLAGIPLAIALLHFLLFFFYRQTKENLYYALLPPVFRSSSLPPFRSILPAIPL